jgi:transcription elongation factor Elf1
MPPHYFKPETLIATRCEHCGTRHKETLARLYSDARLICSVCGQEHTAERSQFRQTVDETEALVDSVSAWTDRLAIRLRRWRDDRQDNRPS